MSRGLTVFVVLLLALAVPTAASAQKPPGNGPVDEYIEGVPGAKGETPSGDVGGGSGGGSGGDGGGAVTPATADSLEASGSDGAAAADLAAATAPDSKALRKAAKSGGDSGQGSDLEGLPDEDAQLTGAVGAAVDGDGDGLGVVLPLILAATVLAGVGIVVARRRRSAGGTPE